MVAVSVDADKFLAAYEALTKLRKQIGQHLVDKKKPTVDTMLMWGQTLLDTVEPGFVLSAAEAANCNQLQTGGQQSE